jgi:hypothetical protein
VRTTISAVSLPPLALQSDRAARSSCCGGVERTLRGLYDGAIQTIAVCERACRREPKHPSPFGTAIFREMLVMLTLHLPGLTWNDWSGWELLRRRSSHREDRQRDACDE